MGRVVLLVTSPRLPAGLLTGDAWDLVRDHPVLAGEESATTQALRAAGVAVELGSVADLLVAADHHPTVVWLAGDEDRTRELAARIPAELAYGSWDPHGAKLLDVVGVMDRLVSPGGDPWKREQTHQTLARYLIEEAYEAFDAIEEHDLEALREELGDVLLQVVLHARMAEEAEPPWSIDDLAADLAEKLVRRNPHVFGSTKVSDVEEITANWERIKREEKSRDSAMDGIALSQPALALAAKVMSRARRAGLSVPVRLAPSSIDDEATLGAALLALVAEADLRGLDPEAALRRAALALARAVRQAESG